MEFDESMEFDEGTEFDETMEFDESMKFNESMAQDESMELDDPLRYPGTEPLARPCLPWNGGRRSPHALAASRAPSRAYPPGTVTP